MASSVADTARQRAIPASVVDVAVIATGCDGVITDWSSGAEIILGWSAEEMIGQPVDRFFTPEDQAAGCVAREIADVLAEGRAAHERWHLRKDGRRFWASGEMMPLRDADGVQIGFVKVLRDRTRERADRETLRETQTRLKRAQEVGGVGLFSVDVADAIIRPTAEFCRLYGVAVVDAAPASLFEGLVLSEDSALVSTARSRADGVAPTDVQYRIRRADTGELRWIARRGEVERDADGRPLRFVGAARDITEQIATAEALHAERAQLAQMFEQAPTFMAILRGPEHRFERANPGYRRLVGGRDVVGMTVAEALPEAVEQGFIGLLDRVYRSGEPFSAAGLNYDMRPAPDAPADRRYLDFVYQPLRDADGAVSGIFVEGADVTERKRVEARQAAQLDLGRALRDLTDPVAIAFAASEVLARALGVSRVGYGIIDKAAETITIDRDWNAPGTASIAGVLHFRQYGSYVEDLKRGDTVVIADARADPRTRDTAAALAAISAAAFVNMPVVEHGETVALLFANHAHPRAWSQDDLHLIRDVAERVRAATERVRSEDASRTSQEQFHVFAQAVPNHVWAARPDGELYWVNDRVYAYSDEISRERGGADWGRIIHPDDVTRAVEHWSRSVATGGVYEIEFRIRRSDSAYRWFLVRAEPVRDAAGTIQHWVGTNTDIDDARRQSAELARLNDTLEEQVETRTNELMRAEEALRQSQKMEAVGQLTGGLAHDFNNLLTGISGSLEMLGVRIAQGRMADVDRYVAAAQGAARRAAALTHRLLAFSRRQTLDPKPTDVNRLVTGMEELVRRTVGPAIALEVVAAAGLWATLVDPNQLENALLNLCINARDAMPDGGRITIETGNRWLDDRAARARDLAPGQYISLCVSDTGTGMPPDVIAKAFDPFFTTKPIGLGTGLGLSMIYGFARQSGGQVRIYSEVGEGALICVYLPRHFGAAEIAEPIPETADVPRAGAGETVLVVDDEPTIRMLVSEVLAELGYAAIEAADGAGGLAILRSDARIDLLVTDVGLPGGMNGRQMADAARVARPDLEVLFITGYAENAVVGNGHLDAGMHVMTKPFAMEALANRIRELIARR